MKKFYTLLALCLMAVVSMSAKDYYTLEGLGASEDYPAVDKFETGVQYFIGNARTNAATFLSPTGGVQFLSSSCLYEFEATGQKDKLGTETYLIKNVESGQYLGNGATTYTSSRSRAQIFTIMPAQVFNAEQDENSKYRVDWTAVEYDARNATADYDTNGNFVLADCFASGEKVCWVICVANSVTVGEDGTTSATYLSTYGGANMMSYRDTNCWAFYKPAKITGEAALEPAFNDILGGEEFDPDNYTVGSGPGEYGEAEVNAMTEAWNVFAELLNNGGSDADCDAAIAKLQAAWDALVASMGTLNDGQFYRFWNWRDNGSYTACIYDGGTQIKWTPNYTAPEELDVEGSKYIWKLVKKDGKNYFQNYYSGRYMSDVANFSTAFPTTAEPTTAFEIEATDAAGAFNIFGSQYTDGRGMHTQVNGNVLVYWYAGSSTNNQGSLWRVETMDPEAIKALEDQLAQAHLNGALQEVLATADATYQKGFAYDQYLNSVEEQMTFNRTETSEGSEGAMHDGDPSTFYHSFWSQQGDLGQPHWFQVQMEEPISEFVFEVTRRGINTNKNGAVTRWVIVGTNDEGLAEADDFVEGDFRTTLDVYKDSWTTYEEFVGEYDQPVVWKGNSYNEAMLTGKVKFTEPVKYVRFLAAGRMTDTYATEEQIAEEEYDPFLPVSYADKPADNIYMCVGELSIHSAEFNPALSVINAVPADVRKALEDAMAQAKAELEAGEATQATIDALEKAYEEFLKKFPEPQVLKDLLTEAQGWVDDAPEGDEVGYFPEGATDELQSVIETVSAGVKDVMSMEEIEAGKKAINDALEALNAKLHMPEPGLYFVKSTTSEEAAAFDSYVGLSGNGATQLRWGASGEGDKECRPGYFWKLTKNEDGTWSLFNCGTGTYLQNPGEDEPRVLGGNAKSSFKLRSARQGGSFNFVFADGVFMNAQPTGNMVTWGAAYGADNSSFEFVEADEEWTGDYTFNYEPGAPQIMTLPYAIKNDCVEPLFKLIGTHNGAFQFDNYGEDELIPAGTPVLYFSNDEEGSDAFTVDAKDITEIKYTYKAGNQLGMIGTIDPIEELPLGSGIFWNNRVVPSEEGEGVAANTGYLKVCDDCGREGELSIMYDETVVGIKNAVVINNKKSTGTYTIQGRQVKGNLPAGLYIVNGKKVIIR